MERNADISVKFIVQDDRLWNIIIISGIILEGFIGKFRDI